MKTLLFLMLILRLSANAQTANCTFKPPSITFHFGTGTVTDINVDETPAYSRVGGACPTDGHYAYASATSDCFRGDWHTLPGDRTGGGNMMIVNASYRSGHFLRSEIKGLKASTIYQFGVWMGNVCRPTEKCPYPLLPDITIRLHTPSGRTVAQLEVSELQRRSSFQWTEYTMTFTAPVSEPTLILTMTDNVPGGCGNDFAVDDITFSECVIPPPPKKNVVKTTTPKKMTPAVAATKKNTSTQKPPATVASAKKPAAAIPSGKKPASDTAGSKKSTVKSAPDASQNAIAQKSGSPKNNVAQKPPAKETPSPSGPNSQTNAAEKKETQMPPELPKPELPVMKEKPKALPPPPAALTRRSNTLFKQLETEAGEVKIDLYDNGEIDGDTVTIYHNNILLVSRVRLSAQPTTLRIKVDAANPHHELVMVANNLGSIPPNTSLMVVTAGGKRYEIFTSATEQRNAKVVFDLKE